MFAAALGTQTQGSIIRPASFCGVIGYKPTWSALSSDGIHPLSTTHDHLGAIADSVDDAWRLARWISERAPQQNAPGLSGPMGDTAIPAQAPRSIAVLRTQGRSEEHTYELQSLMRISYAVFCLKKKITKTQSTTRKQNNRINITY